MSNPFLTESTKKASTSGFDSSSSNSSSSGSKTVGNNGGGGFGGGGGGPRMTAVQVDEMQPKVTSTKEHLQHALAMTSETENIGVETLECVSFSSRKSSCSVAALS